MTYQLICPKVAFLVLVTFYVFLMYFQNDLLLFILFPFFSAYHAGLNNTKRTSVLDDWISSKIKVVVATVAFGYVSPFYVCIN